MFDCDTDLSDILMIITFDLIKTSEGIFGGWVHLAFLQNVNSKVSKKVIVRKS